MHDYLTTCEEAARLGGATLLDWRGKFTTSEKGPADLVTEADFASQEAIQAFVLERFADHGFLGEENPAGENAESLYQWIVDPLDGTTNYVHGLPNYSVSVALRHDGNLLAGAVYDPVLDESFTGKASGGAFLNGEKLRVSKTVDSSQALVAVSFPANVSAKSADVDNLLKMIPRCRAFRRMGSAALNLCYLAAGRLDAYWASSTKIWDVAAGILLVREAGGIVTDVDGGPIDLDRPDFLAASTKELHAELLDILAG